MTPQSDTPRLLLDACSIVAHLTHAIREAVVRRLETGMEGRAAVKMFADSLGAVQPATGLFGAAHEAIAAMADYHGRAQDLARLTEYREQADLLCRDLTQWQQMASKPFPVLSAEQIAEIERRGSEGKNMMTIEEALADVLSEP